MTAHPAPEVSVIIPCYNVAQTLPLQLEALDTQADAPSFEVIIVDNNSTDDLDGVVRSWKERVSFDLRLVSAHETQGSSYARNVGIRESRADLLMFCDGDGVVSRWWVAQGHRTFGSAPLWSGSAIPLSDADMSRPLEEIRELFDDTDVWRPPVDEQDTDFPILMGGDFGATKQTLVRLGGFDQSLAHAGDDNDLAFRARRTGLPVVVSKTVRIGYRKRADAGQELRSTFRAARAHALIATRYDAWASSPYPHWGTELLRCAGACVKMAVRPRQRDWPSLAVRTASAVGIATGHLQYRMLGRQPIDQIGRGLDRDAGAS